MSRPSLAATRVALQCTRPLLAYNKSGGYRWSPIPKPPPPHVDRLYGTHSVLNTLRVAARRQQQHQQQQQQKVQTKPEVHGSTSVPPSAADNAAAIAAAITAPAGVPQWHPHRAELTCLYVRDFSIEEDHSEAGDGEGAKAVKGTRGRAAATSGGRRKKIIPTRYTAVRCITALAKSMSIPVRFVPRAELVQLCGERRNQNVVLEASSYTPVKLRQLGDIWAKHAAASDGGVADADAGGGGSGDGASPVTVLFLEHIVDPTNIGGILRTAFFFGIDHVVLSRQCAACTAAVSRTSTGFLEHLHVYRATTSSVDFLRASHYAFGGRGGAAQRLEVIASTVVSEPLSPSPALPPVQETAMGSRNGDPTTAVPTDATRDTREASASATPGGSATSSYPPAVRVVLLGNEDAGLPSELLEWCTHVAHIQSPRQAQLRRARSSAAWGGGEEDGEHAEAACGTADAPGTAASPSATSTRTELEKWQHNLRRLAQLRDKEVSLNVNTATAALLSSLCSVPEALTTNVGARSSSGRLSRGLVEVRALHGAAP